MSKPSPRRTRAGMTAETTAALIAAARTSFAEKGFAETSIDQVAAEIGLTKGAVYHHFGGKVGLFEAVVRALDAEIYRKLDRAWQSTDTAWIGFKTCIEAYLKLALVPEIRRILFQEAPSVLGERLRQMDAESSIEPMTQSLRQAMKDGDIVDVDPEAMARAINGAVVDVALWIGASDAPEEQHGRALESIRRLLDGLTPDG